MDVTKKEKEVGKVGYWNVQRGFGFVNVVRDGVLFRYFLHASQIICGEPTRGADARFHVEAQSKGLAAINVEIGSAQAGA